MAPAKRTKNDSKDVESEKHNDIVKRLDALISLICMMAPEEMRQTEKILLLAGHGFAPMEIAGILRTSSNTVNVALSRSRKEKKQAPSSARDSCIEQDVQLSPDSGGES